MPYKVKDIKKVYENKLKMINENIKYYGEMDRDTLVNKCVNTFDFINEQVDVLEDKNIKVEYILVNDTLHVSVVTDCEKYCYSFNPDVCNVEKGKFLKQTGNIYLNMMIKQALINEINNISLPNDTKLYYNNNNRALFAKEYSLVGEYNVNLKKGNNEYKLTKDALKAETSEVPSWVVNELEEKKCKKLFRRR